MAIVNEADVPKTAVVSIKFWKTDSEDELIDEATREVEIDDNAVKRTQLEAEPSSNPVEDVTVEVTDCPDR